MTQLLILSDFKIVLFFFYILKHEHQLFILT